MVVHLDSTHISYYTKQTNKQMKQTNKQKNTNKQIGTKKQTYKQRIKQPNKQGYKEYFAAYKQIPVLVCSLTRIYNIRYQMSSSCFNVVFVILYQFRWRWHSGFPQFCLWYDTIKVDSSPTRSQS